MEQKISAIAVHYRALPALEPALQALLSTLVSSDADDFALSPAHMCWEIRPRGIHKGTAVRRLMRESPFHGSKPVFVGDDVTDEDAFVELRDRGIGIVVGDDGRPTAAHFRLADTDAVMDLLERIADGVAQR